jgi:SAM-dependent methyltransferase
VVEEWWTVNYVLAVRLLRTRVLAQRGSSCVGGWREKQDDWWAEKLDGLDLHRISLSHLGSRGGSVSTAQHWRTNMSLPPTDILQQAVGSAPANPNKALWEKGDFTRIAQSMRESGEALVQRLGITKGLRVLDLGCGDGTTALPEARLGADVLGVDIARNLLEAGTKRAQAMGLRNCTFQEGDATHLAGIEDGRFDLVVSIFGAMFAPKPFDVAKEMVRVTRPGGRIVMGNWIPNDPTLVAQILKISSAYTPPPPDGFISPMTWGVEENVLERFGAAGVSKGKIVFARDSYTFQCALSPSAFVDEFLTYYGPTMNALDGATKAGREAELTGELNELFTRQNQSSNPNATSITATFLRVTVTR